MLIAAVAVLAVLLGYACGGRLKGVLKTDIRGLLLPIIAFVIDFSGAPLVSRFPGLGRFTWIFVTVQYALLFVFILINLFKVSFCLFGLGTLLNFLVISLNGFCMPVSRRVLGMTGEKAPEYISKLTNGEIFRYCLADADTRLPFLGDIIVLPLFGGFASVGDLLLALGFAVLIVTVMLSEKRSRAKTAFSGGSFTK